MASTFKSVEVTRGDAIRAVTPGVFSVFGTYELAAALVVNDVIQMVNVPAGARILRICVLSDDLDSAGPAIVLDVGDDGDTDRFLDGLVIGGTGGVDSFPDSTYFNSVGFGYQYTANNTIDILVETAPTTGAATGTLSMIVFMSIDD